MAGKREIAARAAVRSGLLTAVRACRPYWAKDLRVLAYHRVLPRSEQAGFPFDEELVSAWTEEFAWQMSHVARHFDVMTCRDAVEALERDGRLPRRALIVTFDDGFADNYEHAFPILRSCGVPAVVFLATDYIGRATTFWFDWLAYVLMHTDRTQVPAPVAGVELDLSHGARGRREAVKGLLAHLKKVADEERHAILDRLRDWLDVAVSGDDQARSRPLTWEQVAEMAAGGIEFGSHTVTHPVLSRVMDDGALERELRESRDTVERRTGQRVVALAYPVGGRAAIDGRVVRAVERAGYKMALTYEPGVNRVANWDRFRLKRLPVERYVDRDMFRALVEAPEVFARGA